MRQYSVILRFTFRNFRSCGKDMTSRTRHYGNMGFLKSHSLANRQTSVYNHLASAGTEQNGETLPEREDNVFVTKAISQVSQVIVV